MITTQTKSFGRRLVEFGIDMAYPRNAPIAIAADWAAWNGYNWSVSRTQIHIMNLLDRFQSHGGYGIYNYFMGIEEKEPVGWFDTVNQWSVNSYYPKYIHPYLPQIHYGVALSAAVAVSISLNLVARIIFGIKSDKSEQKEPLATALGVSKTVAPATPKVEPTQTSPPTPPQLRPKQEAAPIKQPRIVRKRPAEASVAEPLRKKAAHHPRVPLPVQVPPPPIQQTATVQVPVHEEHHEPEVMKPMETPIQDVVLPTKEPTKEAKELLFDQEEYRKFAAEQACCWNPLNIVKIVTC